MSSFDPSIISQIGANAPNPIGAQSQAYQLKDLVDENKVNDFKLNQLSRQEDEEKAQREILKTADFSTPQGWMEASQKAAKAGYPDLAISLQRQYQNAVTTGFKNTEAKQSIDAGQLKIVTALSNIVGPAALTIKQTMQTKGVAMAEAQWAQMRPQLVSQLPPDLAARIPATPPKDPQQFSAMIDAAINNSQQAQKILMQQSTLTKNAAQTQAAQQKVSSEPAHEAAYQANIASQIKSREVDPSTVEDTARMIATGQMPMLGGFVLKTPWGQAVVARVSQLNPKYNYATATSQAAGLKAFTSGKEGNTVRSLNVAINHMDTLSGLASALHNKDTPAVNRIANTWKTQTGESAPTTFTAARNIVANEVVKAVTASGGTLADREEAQQQVQAASSPAQLSGVIQSWKALLSGQLSGLRQQYEQSTGQKDFERFLSPQVKSQLESPGGAAQGGAGSTGSTPSGSAPSVPTATGPNGQKLVLKNGQWVPLGQ